MYEELARKLENGDLIILDGGTGTDIERRGVSMNDECWCAMANFTDGETVRAVHEDYLRAGAEVVTANTYASSPVSFAALGREGEIEALDREAVRLAKQAVDRAATSPVAVAGSISVMPAIERGTEHERHTSLDTAYLRQLYRRKAEVLAEAGCDLLLMEMMRDVDHSLIATEAAVATGLPVWVGMAVERVDGQLLSHDNHGSTLAAMTRELMATGATVALVMHTDLTLIDDALAEIGREWEGPTGAYPEAGYFEMPHWVPREVAPEAFVEACKRWRAGGASVLGGCCGMTPAHIEALALALADSRH